MKEIYEKAIGVAMLGVACGFAMLIIHLFAYFSFHAPKSDTLIAIDILLLIIFIVGSIDILHEKLPERFWPDI